MTTHVISMCYMLRILCPSILSIVLCGCTPCDDGYRQPNTCVFLESGYGFIPAPPHIADALLGKLRDVKQWHHWQDYYSNATDVIGPSQCTLFISNYSEHLSAVDVGCMGPAYICSLQLKWACSDQKLYDAIVTFYVTSGMARALSAIAQQQTDAIDKVYTAVELGWIDNTGCPAHTSPSLTAWFAKAYVQSIWDPTNYMFMHSMQK